MRGGEGGEEPRENVRKGRAGSEWRRNEWEKREKKEEEEEKGDEKGGSGRKYQGE